MKDRYFYNYHDAVKYQRYLRTLGIKSGIYSAYNWSEQRETHHVVIEK